MMDRQCFSIIFNIVWFQVSWFACVLIGNKAALVVLLIISIAYLLIDKLRIEWPLIVGIGLLGLIVDISLIQLGVLKSPGLFLPPFWLSVLWVTFATTINHSLKPLLDKRALFLVLAIVGGPFCYKLGVQLSNIQFGYQHSISLMIIAVTWLVAGLVILKLYDRWKMNAIS